MNFNKHSELVGLHALLSASKYHWTNYSDEKLETYFISSMAAQRGTELHAFAAEAIRLGIKLPNNSKTLNAYVNDALGYRMTPEQVLFYSRNCFGTADAIAFRRNLLRIHDLKNGVSPVSVKQLEIYMALFCLEYGYKPEEIKAELRIYQSDDVLVHIPDPEDIQHIIRTIIKFDCRIEELRQEVQ